MKNRLGIHCPSFILPAFLLITHLIACKKPDQPDPQQNRMPPNVEASSISGFVSAGIDSLILESFPTYDYTWNEPPFSANWDKSWSCVKKPDGAPVPVITNANQRIAIANGLVAGNYIFEITYSTKAGAKKASLPIEVVPDIPTGSSVQRADLLWTFDNQFSDFVDKQALFSNWTSDPTRLIYKGRNRLPKVEYEHPETKKWIQLTATLNDQSPVDPDNYAWFELSMKNPPALYIKISDGATDAWVAEKPMVRLTY